MQKQFELVVNNLAELNSVAKKFVEVVRNSNSKFIALYGEMGAGKTTFTNEVLKVLHVEHESASPTFGIIASHHSPTEGIIYHCDFYRLNNEREVLDIGFEEMLNERAWIFAEWPEKLGNLLPLDCVKVRISDENGRRKIDVRL